MPTATSAILESNKEMKANKRTLIIAAIVAFCLAWASAAMIVLTRKPPIPHQLNQTGEQFREFIKSDEFKKMKRREQRRYIRAVMGLQMVKRAETYYQLPRQKRIEFLDKTIDMMQKRREEFRSIRQQLRSQRMQGESQDEQNRTESNSRRAAQQRTRRRRGRNIENMRARRESIDPRSRALNAKFRRALRQRMQQRGIEPPRRP